MSEVESGIKVNTRKLASVCTVDSVSAIENADSLEVVTLAGKCWKIVNRKGDLKVGNRVVYFEIDSFLPVGNPNFEFLRDRCYKKFIHNDQIIGEGFRVKTIKLRGVVSQGLVMPLSALSISEVIPDGVDILGFNPNLQEGDDLTDTIGVKNYDTLKEEMDMLQGKMCCGNHAGNFPSFIPKTDEERIQNLSFMFTNPEYKEMEFEETDKFDGSSFTAFFAPMTRPDNPFGVCSRRFELKLDDEKSDFVKVAKALELDTKLATYGREIAIQAELVGPGMNGNKDKYTEKTIFVYRIWDILNQKFLTPSERYQVCTDLGLKHVKVKAVSKKVFQELDTMDKMLAYVDDKTENGNTLEGRVWKSTDGSISFKCINNRYLLKQAEEKD
jgi:RNA ligase (TIGR02306 family)